MVSGPASASSLANRACLASSRSTIASMTTLALATSSRLSATAMRSTAALASVCGHAALLHQAVEHLGDVVLGGLGGARLLVVGDDAHAALRRHLHDAAPHGAGADHADGHVGCVGIEGHRAASLGAVHV